MLHQRDINKIFIFIIFLWFSGCKSISLQKKIIIYDGYGLKNSSFQIGNNISYLDSIYPHSDTCYILTGKFFKYSDDETFIDTRKWVKSYTPYKRCYPEKGIIVLLNHSKKIEKLFFDKSEYSTSKGISINDTKKKILKKYGDNYQFDFYPVPSKNRKKTTFKSFGLPMMIYPEKGIGFVLNRKGKRVIKIFVFKGIKNNFISH